MPVLDKAVSTEDLCAEEEHKSVNLNKISGSWRESFLQQGSLDLTTPPNYGILRLEAILNTLVENKVEALKHENEKSSSLHSSPKSILGKLKFHSSPKATSVKIEDETRKRDSRKKDRKDRVHVHRTVSESRQFKRQVLRQETSSPDSQIYVEDKCSRSSRQYKSESCMNSSCQSQTCYCSHAPISTQGRDEYIAIKMDGFEDVETDAIIAREELRRARRKRRRRRKRRIKKRLALNAHLVDSISHQDSEFKSLNEDELPPRAKWTIVATACLLLFLCLLLVAITLRMAPLIDEIGSRRLSKIKSLEDIPAVHESNSWRTEGRRKSEQLHNWCRDSTKRARKINDQQHQRAQAPHIENLIFDLGSEKRSRSNSRRYSRRASMLLTRENNERQKRRKIIINIIVFIYLVLFCVSVLSVVITLTHTSTRTVVTPNNNSTKNVTYYTFSPYPSNR